MRCLVSASCVVVAIVGLASPGSAQSIVDLRQPPSGKSRFVLNADMTPADLAAAAEAEAAKPVAAVSRVPACGKDCKLEQQVSPRDKAYGYRDEPGSAAASSGTGGRVVVVSTGSQTQQAAKPAAAPRSGFRMRRR